MVINMIYDHTVKHNGKYYAAGEEVPENSEPLSSDISDNNIDLESDVVSENKTTARRGRPKKSE